MGDKEKSARVNWVYLLKKVQVIETLKKYTKQEIDEKLSIDELRKILVKKIRESSGKDREVVDEVTKENETKDLSAAGQSESDHELEVKVIRKSEAVFKMSEQKFEFSILKDDWDLYIERLELYFMANEVPAEKQIAVLLTKVGMETYKLIRDLCAPAKPKDKSFTQIVAIVKNHLNPKKNEVMERCKFQQAKQTPTESIADFIARLKELSLHCNFADLNAALRDQIVCGVRDHNTRVALFSEEDLTYEKAVKLATTRETALKNAANTDKTGSSTSSVYEVKSLGTRKYDSRRQFQNTAHKPETSGGFAKPKSQQRTGAYAQANNQEFTCYCCNQANDHWARDCRHRFKTCTFCNIRGHIEPACRKKKGQAWHQQRTPQQQQRFRGNPHQRNVHLMEETRDTAAEEEGIPRPDSPTDSTADFYPVFNEEIKVENDYNQIFVTEERIKAEPMFIDVKVNNSVVKMEVDTGTYVTAMSEITKLELFPNIETLPSDVQLTSYGKVRLYPKGKINDLQVEFNGIKKSLSCYIMEGKGPTLVGRQWLQAFGCWPLQLQTNKQESVHHLESSDVKSEMMAKFPNLFSEGQGTYKGRKIHLTFKDNVVPVQLKPYHPPFAMAPKVTEELDRLVKMKCLEPVKVSKWGTPIIPVIKTTGKVRLCGNFKLTVNPNLIIKRHPTPIKEKIFKTLQVGSRWSQIDLAHAFMQFEVDEESRDALTITTEDGLFRYTRLPEGVASSPAECQEILCEILKGISHTEIYIDNIYCTGTTEEEHLQILTEIFSRLEKAGLKVNLAKCDFFKTQIEILGFVIDEAGLHPAPSKIKAVQEAPGPKDHKTLQAFLGLVNFYECFLPDRANHIKPLYDLSISLKYKWTEECEVAFKWIKKQITSDRVLVLFDPDKQIVLACDASYYGLSAILSHRFDDGSERPIAFASKIIPQAELHRTILDKEAGAIIFGFKKFYQFVYGAPIILKTDHEPLKFIFGKSKNLSVMIQNRLQRWAYFLGTFTYTIEIVKSKSNGNCDALSRLPIEDDTPVFESDCLVVNYIEEGLPVVDFKVVARETIKDKDLHKVVWYVQNQWPHDIKLMTDFERNFFSRRLELSVEKGCLLWGHRVVIPISLQARMLMEIHATHFGIVKMKKLAKSYIWWPNLDSEIEEITSSCKTCLESRKEPPKVALTPWPWPSKPWLRIHTDFCKSQGHMFMLVVDAHSKWPEIIDMKTNTETDRVISAFKKMFCRFGLPEHVVSDNGPQYTSDDFKDFLKRNGICQSFSPPYNPATNGAAENFVKTFKDKIDKIVRDKKTLEYAVNLFLFDYRTTEHCTTGRTPAWLMYKRELRTRFDILKPDVQATVEKQQFAQTNAKSNSRKCEFSVQDEVFVKDYRRGSKGRCPAKIEKKLSPVTYSVKLEDGTIWKRHVNQMIKGKHVAIENNKTTDQNKVVIRRSERIKAQAGAVTKNNSA